ncbi:MAG: glycosyltransferase family 4 protein [Planctomycetes bacterium]|nr:glycosyltransferase family 4 protein [Planctomycetota bacterium]MBT7012181.1 glycosyltransferase family 4 protein [Planctomycetota bacterium]MBT7317941.1 glycosyltransferase family 4 protein [Planctomycetota bacterium]
MKILHLHDGPHIHGGATEYLRQLLPQMESRGHETCLFSLDHESPDASEARPSAHYRYPFNTGPLRRHLDFRRHNPALAHCLTQFIQAEKPDLVHIQNLLPFRRTVFSTIQYIGLPLLMTVHDFTLVDPNPAKAPRVGLKGAVLRVRDHFCLKVDQKAVFEATSRFLCPTQALQEGIPFPDGKTVVQRLPIALQESSPLETPKPDEGHLRIFFAGTLFTSKGVDILLHALHQAKGRAAEATLEIAGQGDQESKLKQLVADLGLEHRVTFLGHLDKAAMNLAYKRAHLQALPSRVPENSPLTVLEAGALGRPSVASHAGGVPELLPPERGWTFPSENAGALAAILEEIAEQPEKLTTRGQNMRTWVREDFSPERHWAEIDQHYRELAPRPKP